MRIIVWGINFAPELTGIAPFNTGLCEYLYAHGHQVEMVTAFPYYPSWKKLPGDLGRWYRTDDCGGVLVHRCWHYVPRRVTTLRRIWHELSFGIASFFRVLFLARADVYIVVSPPLILGPLASLIGWLKQRPYVFHVQDLQPDAAVGLRMVKAGGFTRLLYLTEAWAYRHAALVSGISEGMMNAFEGKGVPRDKRVLFPNWIRWHARTPDFLQAETPRAPRAAAFRTKHGIHERTFLASYSGNLGRKQGLETLGETAALLAGRTEAQRGSMPREGVESTSGAGDSGGASRPRLASETGGKSALAGSAHARSTQDPDLLILIVGDGAVREELEARIARLGLTNVRMLPLLAEDDYVGLLAASDVSLILQASGTGQYFLPSKLLSVLSSGSPVVSVADADSELAKAVAAGGFGENVPPAQPLALANALTRLANNRGELENLRRKTEWVRQFSGGKVLGEFERRLRALLDEF